MKSVPNPMIETLKNHQSFLILTHKKPDGDAVGSAIALGKALKALGKDVDYYIDTPVEEKLRFFSEISYFNEPLAKTYDVIVLLDCSTLDHAHAPKQLPVHKVLAVIDHHKSNAAYGDINFIEITAATAELVYRIDKALGVTLDSEMIDAVFTGLSTDTGSFQFSNVTSETHEILSELYKLKDNFAVLSKKLHSEKSYSQMKLYGKAVESMSLFADNTIALIILKYEDISKYGGPLNITDDIANIGMNTIGVQLSATLKEVDNGTYRVSLRSKTPFDIDVSELAKVYGGGGHARAAGFNFSGDLKVLKEQLRALVEKQRMSDNG